MAKVRNTHKYRLDPMALVVYERVLCAVSKF